MGEQLLRQTVACFHQPVVRWSFLTDTFFHDYYADNIPTAEPGRPLSWRIHGYLLFARKSEASPEWLEQRRHDYLEMSAVLPRVAVVDATRPLAEVDDDVADTISNFYRERVTADGHR